jgi:mono/diheme cytochrome c family protein
MKRISGFFALAAYAIVTAAVFSLTSSTTAADPKETIDFAHEIQPILARRCFKCHGSGEAEGGLRLNTREGALAELDSGDFAVVPGKSAMSAILHRITSTDKDERMPPEGKPLTEKEVATIKGWVEQGANWGQHWAFTKVERPEVPATKKGDWVRNPIDAFILSRLEGENLSPSLPADKVALLRRAYYDVIGMPPTPEEVDAFLADTSDNAFEKVVDRLLKSPHYGEKWARHWLDLVRYADTNGYERDNPKDNVWKYRDYIIQALNQDKPYDQFVIDQLAGDELENVTPESITATGFYRLGLWDDEPVDRLQAYYDGLDDVIVTSTQAFLGMTVGCARCHDHKLDPIPQTDYYKMLAFFHNLRHGNTQRDVANDEARKKFEELTKLNGEQLKSLRDKIAEVEKRIFETLSNPEKEDANDAKVRQRLMEQRRAKVLSKDELREYMALIGEEKRMSRTQMTPLSKALAAQEKGDRGPETFVLMRGSAHNKGEKVEPGFPEVISKGKPNLPETGRNGSSLRRLTLAKWIASPDNPLTARVMMNRIWQFHFGRGIVRSSSDFGYQGTAPTHPLLLDWLAAEFVERDWSMKSMHKLIMMSNAYQMSTKPDSNALTADPTNNLFWRFDMRRLTAEEIRDAILSVGGTFNPKMFGPNIFPPLPREVLQTASRPGAGWRNSSPEESARRSIYIHAKRSLRHPMMAGFDAPDTDSACAVRVSTTVPTQALSMLNSKFMNDQAAIFASRLRRERPDELPQQVALAIRLVAGRMPANGEVEDDLKFIGELQTEEDLSPDDALKHYCLVMLNTSELIYLE